jgi:hypothetical protein
VIRRDYILRMIEEFVCALAKITRLKSQEHWREAGEAIDEEFKRLIGEGAERVNQLSESELLARVIEGDSTQAVRDRTLILVALLKEFGDTSAAQGQIEHSRSSYLKALHLLLDTLNREDVFEWPDFVPTIDAFVMLLRDSPLPMRTHAMLMQHHERAGDFARAEDALFAMLDAEPVNPTLVEFGIAFYERLQHQSDEALVAGNLPRAEVEAGLKELLARRGQK